MPKARLRASAAIIRSAEVRWPLKLSDTRFEDCGAASLPGLACDVGAPPSEGRRDTYFIDREGGCRAGLPGCARPG
jgi:hypothetical protein